MAIVNPELPQARDPDYLRYSKPIGDIPPDVSGKLAWDTAGQALETGVSVIDTSIKEGIKDSAYKQIDPLRDQYTQGLEAIKASLDKGVIPAPVQAIQGATSGKTSLLDANDAMDPEDLPPGLDSGLDRIRQLADAKAAGSPRLNDTQFAKDTLSVAKQLRNQYGTGYRDYIDQEVSKVSGLPVANSYYQNMLQDINRQLVQMSKTAKDDPAAIAMKNLDIPGMVDSTGQGRGFLDQYKAGQMSGAKLLGIIGDHQAHESTLKINALEAAEADRKDASAVKKGTATLATDLNNEVSLRISGVVESGGLGSYEAYQNYFLDAAKNPKWQSEAQVQQRAQQYNAFVAQFGARLSSIAASRAPLIGGKAAQDEVNNAMTPIRTLQSWVNDKDNGPTVYAMKQAQAIRDDADYNFLINKDWGQVVQQVGAARKELGDQYLPTFISNYIQSDMDLKFKGVLSQENMTAVQSFMDNRGQQVPRYMKNAIEHGKEIEAPGDYHGNVFQIPQQLADPKMPLAAKDKMIQWAYAPQNRNILGELNKDYRDPQTGAWVPGKYHGFNLLASPKITDAVAETAKTHPENYKMYKDHLENEFGTAYRSDLLDLNKILEKPYLNAHFSFNDQTNNFGLVNNKNQPIVRNDRALGIENPNAVYLNGMLDKLDLINSATHRISYMHSKDPEGSGDTPKYLLQLLQTSGFRPGENITNATEGMAKAIIKSKSPDMTPDQVDQQIMKFSQDSKSGPSVAQFVSNPTGTVLPKAPKGIRGNLSDEPLLGVKDDSIPAGMSAREFIQQLKREGRY